MIYLQWAQGSQGSTAAGDRRTTGALAIVFLKIGTVLTGAIWRNGALTGNRGIFTRVTGVGRGAGAVGLTGHTD